MVDIVCLKERTPIWVVGKGNFMVSNVLGERIRHARVEMNVSIEEVGEKVGISSERLSLIESGKMNLSFTEAIYLSEALVVPLHEVVVLAAMKELEERKG